MKRAIITRAIGVFLIGLLPVVAGCSGQDIQFEGKVFDAMGISGPAARPKDKKMAERAPLVMPPQSQLPPPGERVAAAEEMNWPKDPELAAKAKRQAKAAEIKKYCAEVGRNENVPFYDEEKARQCPSLLSGALQNAFGRAPEPDNQ